MIWIRIQKKKGVLKNLVKHLRRRFLQIILVRSSRLKVFCRKGVLRNYTTFTWKQLCQSLFFNKVPALRPLCYSVQLHWNDLQMSLSSTIFFFRISIMYSNKEHAKNCNAQIFLVKICQGFSPVNFKFSFKWEQNENLL